MASHSLLHTWSIFAVGVFLLSSCSTNHLSKIPRPEGRYSPAIYSAGSAGFSSDRAASLRTIAAKGDLTESEQIYLVKVLKYSGGFSSDKKDVLLALLNNRSVSDFARHAVADAMPYLNLSSSDAKVVADSLAKN